MSEHAGMSPRLDAAIIDAQAGTIALLRAQAVVDRAEIERLRASEAHLTATGLAYISLAESRIRELKAKLADLELIRTNLRTEVGKLFDLLAAERTKTAEARKSSRHEHNRQEIERLRAAEAGWIESVKREAEGWLRSSGATNAALDRAEAAEAEVKRLLEPIEGHPGMCCGQCARRIADAEAEIERLLRAAAKASETHAEDCDMDDDCTCGARRG